MITFLAAVIVIVSAGIVAWPLFKKSLVGANPITSDAVEVGEILTQKDAALFALSELETDYETGSLSQTDYEALKKKYEEKAVALIKTVDDMKVERSMNTLNSIDDEIENRVAAMRSKRIMVEADIESPVKDLRQANKKTGNKNFCPGCGSQANPDDLFCARCGYALSSRCPGCSAKVNDGDIFCAHCGTALSPEKAV